jgi:predicted deacylase
MSWHPFRREVVAAGPERGVKLRFLEYEGQIAVKRLCRDLDPREMSGRVILMPQLSESACVAHTRVSPEDHVNMNRAFPGNARGTLSYRIAHFVKTGVFPNVRVVIDLHAGGHEASFPLCTSLHPIPDPAQWSETLRIATLFDTPKKVEVTVSKTVTRISATPLCHGPFKPMGTPWLQARRASPSRWARSPRSRK